MPIIIDYNMFNKDFIPQVWGSTFHENRSFIMPPKLDLIKFVTTALQHADVQALVGRPAPGGVFNPKVTAGEVLAIVQMVCAAAEVVCPVVNSLPTE